MSTLATLEQIEITKQARQLNESLHSKVPVRLLAVIIEPTFSRSKNLNGSYEIFLACKDGCVRVLYIPFRSSGWIGVDGFQVEGFWEANMVSYLQGKNENVKGHEWGCNLRQIRREVIEDCKKEIDKCFDRQVIVNNPLIRFNGRYPIDSQTRWNGPTGQFKEAPMPIIKSVRFGFWTKGSYESIHSNKPWLYKLGERDDISTREFESRFLPEIATLPVLPLVYSAHVDRWPDCGQSQRHRARSFKGIKKLWIAHLGRLNRDITAVRPVIERLQDDVRATKAGKITRLRFQRPSIGKSILRAVKSGRASTKAAREWFAKNQMLSRFLGWAEKQHNQ